MQSDTHLLRRAWRQPLPTGPLPWHAVMADLDGQTTPRFPSRNQRQARRNPHSHNNIRVRNPLQHNAIGSTRVSAQTNHRLIMNTANTRECITAGQEGVCKSQQTPIRTSLRLGQFFANRFERDTVTPQTRTDTADFAHASHINCVGTQQLSGEACLPAMVTCHKHVSHRRETPNGRR